VKHGPLGLVPRPVERRYAPTVPHSDNFPGRAIMNVAVIDITPKHNDDPLKLSPLPGIEVAFHPQRVPETLAG
jgi:hypothetical protein